MEPSRVAIVSISWTHGITLHTFRNYRFNYGHFSIFGFAAYRSSLQKTRRLPNPARVILCGAISVGSWGMAGQPGGEGHEALMVIR